MHSDFWPFLLILLNELSNCKCVFVFFTWSLVNISWCCKKLHRKKFYYPRYPKNNNNVEYFFSGLIVSLNNNVIIFHFVILSYDSKFQMLNSVFHGLSREMKKGEEWMEFNEFQNLKILIVLNSEVSSLEFFGFGFGFLNSSVTSLSRV